MNPNQPNQDKDQNKKPNFAPEAGSKPGNPGVNQQGKSPENENEQRQREQRKASGA